MDTDTQHEKLPGDAENPLDAAGEGEIDEAADPLRSSTKADTPPSGKRNACTSPQPPPALHERLIPSQSPH